MEAHSLMSRARGLLFIVSALCLLIDNSYASELCTDRFDFLGCSKDGFWLWRRGGGDCVGSGLWRFTVRGDSVETQLLHDWTGDTNEVLGEQLERTWEFCQFGEAGTSTLRFPGLGITLQSPDSITITPLQPGGSSDDNSAERSQLILSRRPPKLNGFRGHVIHWEGCAKYANYLLRSAYADTSAGFILLITHSDWGFNFEGYGYNCNPGDGVIVIRIDTLEHPNK